MQVSINYLLGWRCYWTFHRLIASVVKLLQDLLFIYFRLCERRFKSQQSLEYHTLQLHDSSTPKTPDSPYRCFHCKETFKSRPELKDHLGTHTDSQETALGSSDWWERQAVQYLQCFGELEYMFKIMETNSLWTAAKREKNDVQYIYR